MLSNAACTYALPGTYSLRLYAQRGGSIAMAKLSIIALDPNAPQATATPSPTATPGTGAIATPTPVPSPSPSPAAGHITITQDAFGKLIITWDAIPGSYKYALYRSSTSPVEANPANLIAVLPASGALTYAENTAFEPGSTVYYLVQGLDANSKVLGSLFSAAAVSNQATATPTPAAQPTSQPAGKRPWAAALAVIAAIGGGIAFFLWRRK